MKKLFCLLTALTLALCCFPALAEGGVTVTDMTGREITLDAPATRIVALTASDVEILYALGAGDTLVGRGEYCDYPAEALAAPSVQSGYETNLEQILALEPQVVVMATMAQTKEQVEALENAGVKVVVSDAQDIAGVYEAIRLLGAVTGKDEAAEALVKSMTDEFAAIAAQADTTGKTVYFEVSPLQYGLWTAGSHTFMDELAALCGLTNAFADLDGWQAISEEQLLERDPDYIVTLSMTPEEGPAYIEEVKGRAGWDVLKAVKNDAILNADNNEMTRPGPRLVDAARQLMEFIGGEAEEPAA